MRKDRHELPCRPVAHVIFKHRQENGDARINNKNHNQQNDADQRANDKMVATEVFQAGEGQRHNSTKGSEQNDAGITQSFAA
ncbi:Uncharacterised protein [Vibrio cholerae]|nr:Uncharacterised protein [Vibrio cholerae]CSB91253.1 Uncharacterised protein [Vibrio cholerae]